jgi:hypothetical protein
MRPTPDIPIASRIAFPPRPTVSIKPADLLRSVYIVGKTGTGKSALLLRLLLGAAERGFGACLIDPTGDLARQALAHLPRGLWNRVVSFRPADADRAVGLNLFRVGPGSSRALVASAAVEAFRALWGSTLFGPRSEHLLRNAALALLETPDATILGLLRILVDADARDAVAARLTDPVVRSFWQREFPSLGKPFAAEVAAPLLNKLGALSAPAVRRALGQVRPKLDMREALDAGRIVIADLSGIGRDGAQLLGAFLVSSVDIAARSRAGLPESERRPFILVADEFHGYVTESFLTLLAEGRKFGLCAALAHQHAAQLPPTIRAAAVGNAGTLIAFALGSEDAELLAPEFWPEASARELARLGRYRIALRLLVDGEPARPDVCDTLAPPQWREPPDTLLRISAERYGRPVTEVDRQIRAALGTLAS